MSEILLAAYILLTALMVYGFRLIRKLHWSLRTQQKMITQNYELIVSLARCGLVPAETLASKARENKINVKYVLQMIENKKEGK